MWHRCFFSIPFYLDTTEFQYKRQETGDATNVDNHGVFLPDSPTEPRKTAWAGQLVVAENSSVLGPNMTPREQKETRGLKTSSKFRTIRQDFRGIRIFVST